MRIFGRRYFKREFMRILKVNESKQNAPQTTPLARPHSPIITAPKEKVVEAETTKVKIDDCLKYSETNVSVEPFDMMTGAQFKDLIERFFQKNCYMVRRITPRINYIDFILEKDTEVIAVATKKTFDLIQRSYISKVIESSNLYENVSSIMVITTSMYFMPQAKQLAEEHNLILWDRNQLKAQIGEIL